MKKAGCYNVAIGVESANNEILKKIGKSTTIEKIKEGIKILKETGIEIMSQYVIGSPHETFKTFPLFSYNCHFNVLGSLPDKRT